MGPMDRIDELVMVGGAMLLVSCAARPFHALLSAVNGSYRSSATGRRSTFWTNHDVERKASRAASYSLPQPPRAASRKA